MYRANMNMTRKVFEVMGAFLEDDERQIIPLGQNRSFCEVVKKAVKKQKEKLRNEVTDMLKFGIE